MEVKIGSNRFIDCNGVLQVQGRDQIKLEIGKDGQLLVTADVYNEQAKHVGKLNRNAWAFHDDRYAATTNPASLTLYDKQTGAVCFAAEVQGPDTIQVHPCRFYTSTGVACTVTDSAVQIGGITLSGTTVNSAGTVIPIGQPNQP